MQNITSNETSNILLGLINQFSHPLITKLATLRLQANFLEEMLPKLQKAYQCAEEHNLITENKIRPNDLNALTNILNLEPPIVFIIELLDVLNATCKQLSPPIQQKIFVGECINKILQLSPFASPHAVELIFLKKKPDIEVCFSPFFIELLLTNLLRTAYLNVENSAQGTTNIWMTPEHNTLHVTIPTAGLSQNARTQIFEQFFIFDKNKLLPGLGFCRLALTLAGGGVTWDIQEDECTHFTIRFPTTNQE